MLTIGSFQLAIELLLLTFVFGSLFTYSLSFCLQLKLFLPTMGMMVSERLKAL